MASEMLKKALMASAHEEYLNIEKICEILSMNDVNTDTDCPILFPSQQYRIK